MAIALETIPKISIDNLIDAYNILLEIEEGFIHNNKPLHILLLFINTLETIININISSYSWSQRMELMYIIRTTLKDKAKKERIQIVESIPSQKLMIIK